MMGHEVLAIAIAALVVWGFAMAALVLDWKPLRQNSGGDRLPSTPRRSLLMVLDEEILVELVLWTWVVFVL